MKSTMKDEELVHLYLDTQQANYFEDLYNRYVSKVYQRCLSLTKDAVQAQDFTQEIFVRVLTKLDHFQERSAFLTWLYAISYNYCMDQLRAGKKVNTVALDETYGYYVVDAEPEHLLNYQLDHLTSIISQMSPKEMEILGLRYEKGLPIDEIARALQLKQSAAKMRLKRVRDKLRTLYSMEYQTEND